MQIVYCTERYWPAQGGAETYLRTIAQEMARDHVVKVVTLIRDERSLVETLHSPTTTTYHSSIQDGRVQIINLALPPSLRAASRILLLEPFTHRLFRHHYYIVRSLWLRYTAQLLRFPLKYAIEGANVIHTVAPWELSHAVNLVKGKIPHIVTGLLHPGYWADDEASIRHFQRCTHIIALSETERQAYLERDIASEKISVIGVPVRELQHLNTHPYRSTQINPNKPIVLFMGVKRSYKGIKFLLDATQYVWEILPQVQFVFVGPRTNYSITIFASITPDARIIEIDTVSEEDKWALLEQCSILCLPSQTEIMPNVILEAWSKHKAVITSNIATLEELVGDAGLCVPLNERAISDAIIHLLQNPTLLKAFGEAGWEKCIHKHSAYNVREKLEETYHALME